MSLTPGTRLGVYEVTAAIGQGGMGQVFRACDTKLNRDVALKILPDSSAGDADRLQRFERQAPTSEQTSWCAISPRARIPGCLRHGRRAQVVAGRREMYFTRDRTGSRSHRSTRRRTDGC